MASTTSVTANRTMRGAAGQAGNVAPERDPCNRSTPVAASNPAASRAGTATAPMRPAGMPRRAGNDPAARQGTASTVSAFARPSNAAAPTSVQRAPTAVPRAQEMSASARAISDLQDATLSYDNMKVLVDGLRAELRMRSEWLQTKNVPQPLKKRLLDELANISRRINRMMFDTPFKDRGAAHQVARHCFADISQHCKKVLKAFPSSARVKDAGVAARDDTKEMARYFTNLCDFTNELKRQHYTKSAHFRFNFYLKQELENFEKIMPGWANQRPGSDMAIACEGGIGLGIGILSLPFKFGVKLVYRLIVGTRLNTDDDGDPTIYETVSNAIQLRALAKFNKDSKHLRINADAQVGVERTRGDYNNHGTVENALRADVKRRADGGWNILNRSGDENSLAARFRLRLQKSQSWLVKGLIGASYAITPGSLCINERKLLKGSFNEQRLAVLAGRLTTCLPGSPSGPTESGLREITRRAYPEIGNLLEAEQKKISSPAEVGRPLFNSVMQRNPVPSPANGYQVGAGKSVRQMKYSGRVTGGIRFLGFGRSAIDRTKSVLDARAEVNYTNTEYRFRRLRPAHAVLDPGYCKDIKQIEAVFEELETDQGHTPKMHTYGCVMNEINDSIGEVSQERLKHIGSTRLTRGIETAAEQINELRKKYIALSNLAGEMHSQKEKRYWNSFSEHDRKEIQARQKAYIEEVFGPVSDHFLAELVEDPEHFMAETYDAISIAFAGVGLCISRLKEAAYESTDPANPELLSEAMTRADMDYVSLRTVMDNVYLPIEPEKLFRKGSVSTLACSKQSALSCGGKVEVNFSSNPIDFIPGNHPIIPLERKLPTISPSDGGVHLEAPIGGVTMGYRRTTRWATDHPSIMRMGEFRLTRGSIAGIGVTAPTEEETRAFILACREKLLKKKKLTDAERERLEQDAHFSPEDSNWARRVARNGIRSGLVEQERAPEFWNCVRTPLPDKERGFTYKSYPQFSRTFIAHGTKFGGTADIPIAPVHGVPLILDVHGEVSESSRQVMHETMGTCPAYHTMQFRQLRDALQKAQFDSVRKKREDDGQSDMRIKPESIDKDCDFAKLRGLFWPSESERSKPRDRATSIDADYMLHKWFGDPETIIKVMEDFDTYQGTRRKIGDAQPRPHIPGEGKPAQRSHFDQLDDTESVWNLIKSKNRAKKFAPGSFASRASAQRDDPARFRDHVDADPRPTLTPEDIKAIKEVRQFMDDNPHMSARQRMDYFLKSRDYAGEMPAGRRVFAAYCKIMDFYDELTEDAKAGWKYKPQVATQ